LEFLEFMTRNEKFSYQISGEVRSQGKQAINAFNAFMSVCNSAWWSRGCLMSYIVIRFKRARVKLSANCAVNNLFMVRRGNFEFHSARRM
jgi:hypothetical protein